VPDLRDFAAAHGRLTSATLRAALNKTAVNVQLPARNTTVTASRPAVLVVVAVRDAVKFNATDGLCRFVLSLFNALKPAGGKIFGANHLFSPLCGFKRSQSRASLTVSSSARFALGLQCRGEESQHADAMRFGCELLFW
jgi:hypothetical protein